MWIYRLVDSGGLMRIQFLVAAVLLATAGCNDSASSGGKDMTTVDLLTPSPMPDMSKPGGDMGPDGGSGGIPGHKGMAVMSGAVKASSTNYKAIMSLGQSPGDNKVMKSTNNKAKTGLVGATQGSK